MSDLLMIVPSRGRPENIAELLEAFVATIANGGLDPWSAKLLVAVDDDDPELKGYRELRRQAIGRRATGIEESATEYIAFGWELVIGPRERVGPTLNRLAVEHAPHHFAIGFMGDDHRPRTVGWDKVMVDILREMGSGIVYGNDLLQGERLPTAVVMTSDIVQALGYMVPPGLVHMYLDNFWLGLGRELKRLAYLPDVIIEHVHPLAGKAEWDDGYREVNAAEMYATDRARLLEWLENEEADALARVRAAIGAEVPA